MPRPTLKAPTSPAAYTTSSASASSSSSSKPPAPHLLQITTAANNPASYSSSSSSSSRSPRAASGVGGAQNQACAACKYQRRKCNPDCPLAAYFPAEQQRRFLNAHRLFGVSNIQKTLRDTEPELRQDAMRALIFQAEARAYDPVGGCCRIALDLQIQLNAQISVLNALHARLDLCRQQALAMPDGPLDVDTGMLLAGGGAVPDQGAGVVDQYVFTDNQMQPAQHQQPHDYFYYDGTASEQDPSRHAWGNVGSVQRQYGNGAADVKTGSSAALGEQLEQHCQIDTRLVHVFDMKPETKATMQHAGNGSGSGSMEHREEKKVTPAVVKSEADHQAAAQMGQSSAASRCQLELGFSSL